MTKRRVFARYIIVNGASGVLGILLALNLSLWPLFGVLAALCVAYWAGRSSLMRQWREDKYRMGQLMQADAEAFIRRIDDLQYQLDTAANWNAELASTRQGFQDLDEWHRPVDLDR